MGRETKDEEEPWQTNRLYAIPSDNSSRFSIIFAIHTVICKAIKGLVQNLRSISRYLSWPSKLTADNYHGPILPIQNPPPSAAAAAIFSINNDDSSLLVQPLLISIHSSTVENSGIQQVCSRNDDSVDAVSTDHNEIIIPVPNSSSAVFIQEIAPRNVESVVGKAKEKEEEEEEENVKIKSIHGVVDSQCHDIYASAAGNIKQTTDHHHDQIISVPNLTHDLLACTNSNNASVDPINAPYLEERQEENELIKSGVVVDKEIKRITHYNSRHRILLVGEGDFSFSTCLARAFVSASNMISTSLDSKTFLKKHYKNAASNIAELSSKGCMVMNGIDATVMADHELLGGLKFDRIVYNFPFAGFFKGLSRETSLRRHRRLVSLFLKNAKEMLCESGEIHISHKTNGFHLEWNLVSMASSHGLRLIEAVEFELHHYPGYNTKCGFGGDDNFNCYPSSTYKFGLKNVRKGKNPKLG